MKNNTQLSFEFFPPKTAASLADLQETAQQFNTLNPEYFSITYGAAGSIAINTLATAVALRSTTNVVTVPHITCVGTTKENMRLKLQEFQQAAINRLVVLRGDEPEQPTKKITDFSYARDLVSFIREESGNYFHIDVAAYPEFHPQMCNPQNELEYFRQKFEAGANAAITQYFFNVDAYFRFVDSCEKAGITVPIVPGIMPISNYEQLLRFSAFCGAEIPRWLRFRLDNIADNPLSMQLFGCEVISELCNKLLTNGVPGLHFYTLNKLAPTLSVCKNLGFEIKSDRESVLEKTAEVI